MDSMVLVHEGDRVFAREQAAPTVVRDVQRPAKVVVTGFPGPRGLPGEKGEPGAGVSVLGIFATLAELQAAHPAGAVGDAYLAGDDLFVWDAAAGAWHDAGPLRGPPGAPGQIRFTGLGPPPTVIVGASPGDTYMDLATGDVYKLT